MYAIASLKRAVRHTIEEWPFSVKGLAESRWEKAKRCHGLALKVARFVRRVKGRVTQTGLIEGQIKAPYPLPPLSVSGLPTGNGSSLTGSLTVYFRLGLAYTRAGFLRAVPTTCRLLLAGFLLVLVLDREDGNDIFFRNVGLSMK